MLRYFNISGNAAPGKGVLLEYTHIKVYIPTKYSKIPEKSSWRPT